MRWICDTDIEKIIDDNIYHKFKIFEFQNLYYGRLENNNLDDKLLKYYLWVRVTKNNDNKWYYRYNLHTNRINCLEQHYLIILRKHKMERLINF